MIELSKEKTPIISDENYYYVFRALNNGDHEDIIKNGDLEIIRTDLKRYNEKHKVPSKYTYHDNVSLEEVWSHCKFCQTKDTNCISLATNPNVVLDYGTGYNNEYALVKIPKKDMGNYYFAGEYVLQEVEKKLNLKLDKINDSNIKSIIDKVDNCQSFSEIEKIVKDNNLNFDKSRFYNRLYLNDEDNFIVDKLISKITILEKNGYYNSVLDGQNDNQSLLATLGMMFSNTELIHYGDIKKDEFFSVPQKMIELLGILSQIKDQTNDKNIEAYEFKIIEYIMNGYDIKDIDNKIYLSNGKEEILLFETNTNLEIFNDQKDNVDIDLFEFYNKTKGRISFEKANKVYEFSKELCKSKKKAYEYSKVLEGLFPNFNYVEKVSKDCYAINKKIIERVNGEGKNICDSVSIGMNRDDRKTFSNDEQLGIIKYLDSLNYSELTDFVNNDEIYSSELFSNVIEQLEDLSVNEYYINSLVDFINLRDIYTNAFNKNSFSKSEKDLIKSKFSDINVKSLYDSFRKLNISNSDISYYILNLVLEETYKGIDIKTLSNLSNLDDIISENIKQLNKKVTPEAMDYLLGIKDNDYVIGDSNIKLRDYQNTASKNCDEIYADGKRFAGVILPTGGGKSFVAFDQMFKHKDENILYLAPNTQILKQIEVYIVEHFAKKDYLKLTEEERQLEIKRVFPHLKLSCYQNLLDKNILESSDFNADFIILDELHRTGGDEWYTKVEELINRNAKAKILGITATPERDDKDNTNMMDKIAELADNLSKEELFLQKHIAYSMDIIDAMQEGIVMTPNIVSFEYNLDNSEQFKQVEKLVLQETDPLQKEKYEKIYNKMKSIIKESKDLGISSIVTQNMVDKTGKYFAFLPVKNNRDISSEAFIQDEMDKLKGYLKDLDVDIYMDYISSLRGSKINDSVMDTFNGSAMEGKCRVLCSQNMLNEGVHADKIRGSFMLRPIKKNRRILYRQQFGRVVFSLDPDKIYKEEEIPVVYDLYNNFLEQDFNKQLNKSGYYSDYRKLVEIKNWIDKHGRIPSVNSLNDAEFRKAKILEKIKNKYYSFQNEEKYASKTEFDKKNISNIIRIGNDLSLWDIDFEELIDGERSNSSKSSFEAFNLNLTATTKTFLELYDESIKLKNKSHSMKKYSDKDRLDLCLPLLDVMSEYGIVINLENLSPDKKLSDFIKELPGPVLEYIQYYGFSDDYRIGEEYNLCKKKFALGADVFNNYEIADLNRMGIFEEYYSDDGFTKKKEIINEHKFIVKGPDEFKYRNIETGAYSDISGNRYDFYEYYDLKESEQFKKGMNLYKILNDIGYKVDFDKIKQDTKLDVIFKELTEEQKSIVNSCGYSEEFPIGENHELLKSKFVHNNSSSFVKYDFEDCKNAGIIDESVCDTHGFVQDFAPKKFRKIHIDTGELSNEYGLTQENIHEYSVKYHSDNRFNYYAYKMKKYGFILNNDTVKYNDTYKDVKGKMSADLQGCLESLGIEDDYKIGEQFNLYKQSVLFNDFFKPISKKDMEAGLIDDFYLEDGTLVKIVDEYGFYIVDRLELAHKHSITGGIYDEKGFNYLGYNKYGFDREHLYHGKEIYNERGFDFNLKNRDTGTIYDKHDFDIDGINKDTKEKYNIGGFAWDGSCKNKPNYYFDKHGYTLEDYHLKNDSKYVNHNGFSSDKTYHLMIDGQLLKFKYNLYGYDYDGNYMNSNNSVSYDANGIGRIGAHLNEVDTGYVRAVYKNAEKYIDRDGRIFGIKGDCLKNDYKIKRIENAEVKVATLKKQYLDQGIFDENYFDKDGYFYIFKDNKFVKSNSKINRYGFRKDGTIVYKDKDGNKTVRTRDKYGFDIKGTHLNGKKYDDNGFDRDGNSEATLTKINEDFFDRNGYYYKKVNGYFVNTKQKFDRFGFNINKQAIMERDGKQFLSEYNERGFNSLFFHKNGNLYDENGFDFFGYYKTGSPVMQDINNKNYTNYTLNHLYESYLYDNIINFKELDRIDTDKKLNKRRFAYNKMYYDESFNASLVDKNGFDFDGFYLIFDENGNVVDKRIYDDAGYDYVGIDKDGINKEGRKILKYKNEVISTINYGFEEAKEAEELKKLIDTIFSTKAESKDAIKESEDLDKSSDKVDAQQDVLKEIEINTESKSEVVSEKVESSEITIETKEEKQSEIQEEKQSESQEETIYDEYGFNEEGIHKVTKESYDENLFNKEGINLLTHEETDFRGFDRAGNINGKLYDENGFDINGIHKTNNSKYFDGYNCYGCDEKGIRKNGQVHESLLFSRLYINSIGEENSNPMINIILQGKKESIGTEVTDEYVRNMLLYEAGEILPEFKLFVIDKYLKLNKEIKYKEAKLNVLENDVKVRKKDLEALREEIVSMKDGRDSIKNFVEVNSKK